LAVVFLYRKTPHIPIKGLKKGTGNSDLDNIIATGGYSYDPQQDIFFSTMDAWQRNFGYCRLYDEAAAPIRLIMDCEPIYFDYNGKHWLIEFWKGQYGITSGGEVGIYATEGPNLNIPGIFMGTFYNSVTDDERIQMSFTLKKDKKILFKREELHWWLTGFKLGEFSEPSQLTMDINITFNEKNMLDAFIDGLKEADYSTDDFDVDGNTISIKYDKPHVSQPLSRTEFIESSAQKKNELNCKRYQDITGNFNKLSDKIKAIKKLAPDIYEEIEHIGKFKELYNAYDSIKDYLIE
jgi:hypothetical protein